MCVINAVYPGRPELSEPPVFVPAKWLKQMDILLSEIAEYFVYLIN
jgi:hypothetical protein